MKRLWVIASIGLLLGVCAIASAQDSLNVTRVWQSGQASQNSFLTVMVDEDLAYCDDFANGRVNIFDVSNRTSPIHLSYAATGSRPRQMILSENLLYVAVGAAGLRVIDVSDPFHPLAVGAYDTPQTAYAIALSGHYAYICDASNNNGSLLVIDISNPSIPTLVGSCGISQNPWAVSIVGSYAFVAANNNLSVVDVSIPSTPHVVATWTPPVFGQQVIGVTNSGSYAYLACTYTGLVILDIQNPLEPTQIGVMDTPGTAWQVDVQDSYAYVADELTGIRVVDITNPAAPFEVGFYDTPGWAYCVDVMGCTMYVADSRYRSAFDISHFRPCPSPPLAPDSLTIVIQPITNESSLHWALVSTNTSGQPVQITRYAIYRTLFPWEYEGTLIGFSIPPSPTAFVDSIVPDGWNATYFVKAIGE